MSENTDAIVHGLTDQEQLIARLTNHRDRLFGIIQAKDQLIEESHDRIARLTEERDQLVALIDRIHDLTTDDIAAGMARGDSCVWTINNETHPDYAPAQEDGE